MSRDSFSPALDPVHRALERLLNASSESRFRTACVAFSECFCQVPGGGTLFTERGEFVQRHTAPDTAYATAWERARKHLGPDVTRILRRQDPQLVSVGELAGVSDAIGRLLEDDISLRVDSLSLVEPDDAETQDQRIDRFLTDQAREALEGLQSAADELVAALETWPSDGCRYLLQIHQHQKDCFEFVSAPTFADEIKAAATFLVDQLESSASEASQIESSAGRTQEKIEIISFPEFPNDSDFGNQFTRFKSACRRLQELFRNALKQHDQFGYYHYNPELCDAVALCANMSETTAS